MDWLFWLCFGLLVRDYVFFRDFLLQYFIGSVIYWAVGLVVWYWKFFHRKSNKKEPKYHDDVAH